MHRRHAMHISCPPAPQYVYICTYNKFHWRNHIHLENALVSCCRWDAQIKCKMHATFRGMYAFACTRFALFDSLVSSPILSIPNTSSTSLCFVPSLSLLLHSHICFSGGSGFILCTWQSVKFAWCVCIECCVYQDSALILKLDYISYIRSSVVVFNSPKNFRLCVRRPVFSFRLTVNLTFPFFMSIYEAVRRYHTWENFSHFEPNSLFVMWYDVWWLDGHLSHIIYFM